MRARVVAAWAWATWTCKSLPLPWERVGERVSSPRCINEKPHFGGAFLFCAKQAVALAMVATSDKYNFEAPTIGDQESFTTGWASAPAVA